MNPSLETQTPVVALASPPGVSALAVIRLSGKGSHELAFDLLRIKSCASLEDLTKRYTKLLRCEVLSTPQQLTPKTSLQTSSQDRSQVVEVIDDGMCVFFKSPCSYTAEDSLEVYVHGGPYVVSRCLEVFTAHGFRAALPGEFTYRAFVHGKIDLTAAEGIQALTGAYCEHEWQAASYLVSGKLAEHIKALRTQMVKARAWLEASMDFPEEDDTSHIGIKELSQSVAHIKQSLINLSSTFRSGQVASEGFKVVLCGRANAGKSTLLNVLSQSDRSIVTDIEGTTRDYLDCVVMISGRKFRFFDTAGLRMPDQNIGLVERRGIEKTLELIQTADVVCLLVPAQDASPISIEPFFEAYGVSLTKNKAKQIRIISQSDKTSSLPHWHKKDDIALACPPSTPRGEKRVGESVLKKKLLALMDKTMHDITDTIYITKPRHLAACQLAIRALDMLEAKITERAYEEILAEDLKSAFMHLGSIIGEVSSDDILDVIFKDFCLGK